jgi:flagellar biosynthesis/type III secretory pathway M-ring protein FliF/YscJ
MSSHRPPHRLCSDPRCSTCQAKPSAEQLKAEVLKLREKTAELIAKNPQKAAAILKLWLESSSEKKKKAG